MDINFECENCGQPLAMSQEDAGKTAKCPKCGIEFTIPAAKPVVASSGAGDKHCPSCGAVVSQKARFCNSCGTNMEKGTASSQKKTSGLAIASLVLAIMGFCTYISCIPGLILGIVGLNRIKRSGESLTGEGMAIAGIVISAVALVLGLPIYAAMLLPALAKARESARRATCLSNLKQIGLGCTMWACEHDEQFPPDLKALYPDFVPDLKVFECPSSADKVRSAAEIDTKGSYIYVSGLSLSSPLDAVLVYEKEENHGGEGRNVLFVDGHVEWVREESFGEVLNRSP